ncbi:MAG: hypothetical protein HY203_09745 [Nitrospirae bacterium]|nr:hypothetical protein [Nitrospirota bacterium]
MIPYQIITVSVMVGILLLTGQASAGWVIDQVSGLPSGAVAEESRQQLILQANRMKTLIYEPAPVGTVGKPVSAFIWDFNAETVTQVDYQKRRYATAPFQDYFKMIQGPNQMEQAMKQMQEALKGLPPEQRKMMEQRMRSQMEQAQPPPQTAPAARVEIRKTDEQKIIAGHPAVRYDIVVDGSPDWAIWIANDITPWKEFDPKKLKRFGAEMAKAMGCVSGPRANAMDCVSGPGALGLHGDDPAWKPATEGYPVQMDTHGGGGGYRVIKAESRMVPAAEFQPPAGFARKTLQEMTATP